MARVLIVDDEHGMRYTLSEFLRRDGHEVETASDADTALRMVDKSDFDVIVFDVVLPRISGVEALRLLREKNQDIQAILMSGEPTVKTTIQAMRSGAFDFLAKPISGRMLCRVVGHAARVKALKDENRLLLEENIRHRENLEELVQHQTQTLIDSEQRLLKLSEATFEGIVIHENGKVLDANPAILAMLGYELEQFVGKQVLYFCKEQDHESFKQHLVDLRFKSQSEPIEIVLIDARKREMPVELRSRQFASNNENIFVTALRDLSEQRKTNLALRQSEERYSRLTENLPDLVWRTTFDGDVLYVNSTVYKMLGYEPSELGGFPVENYLTPDSISNIRQAMKEALTADPKRDTYRVMVDYKHKDGSLIPAEIHGILVRGKSGRFESIEGISRDVSKRIDAEREREKILRLVETSEDFVGMADLEGRVTYLNRAGREMVGLEAQEQATSLTIFDYAKPELRHEMRRKLKHLLDGGSWEGTAQIRHFGDGKEIELHYYNFLIRDPRNDEPLCMATIMHKTSDQD